MTLPDESRVELGKVNKFVIGWCIPLIVAADNTEGGGPCQPLPLGVLGLNRKTTVPS